MFTELMENEEDNLFSVIYWNVVSLTGSCTSLLSIIINQYFTSSYNEHAVRPLWISATGHTTDSCSFSC